MLFGRRQPVSGGGQVLHARYQCGGYLIPFGRRMPSSFREPIAGGGRAASMVSSGQTYPVTAGTLLLAPVTSGWWPPTTERTERAEKLADRAELLMRRQPIF